MAQNKAGNQTIGCTVTSCRHNDEQSHYCQLNRVEIEPCRGCHTGDPADESLCGSYRAK
ncbi:MAG: DUF1540 domain-containing protein [Christensenellales bacterium]|nr:DUF1540 domain-containing protein [Eubacteriales bacterium]MCI6029169.1 DUF1540 domain-containing protein [Clostridiales bacterium]MDD7414634.1 DUF1540 domain-containing protein [Clostridiales bacterium]MDY5732535.1 DUF1540 domain-containing protein [Eubacteriales bacterium]